MDTFFLRGLLIYCMNHMHHVHQMHHPVFLICILGIIPYSLNNAVE